MKEPRGKELIERYKSNYGISVDAPITEKMILQHWEMEKALTKQLLNSTPQSRGEIFEKCYTDLYESLPWLNALVQQTEKVTRTEDFEEWKALIGQPPRRIYEIGSGKGEMIHYLAQHGYQCVGTEVTHERGHKHAADHLNLTWEITDGVHLDKFTSRKSYDVVLSDQVIEHLHPDDISIHFQSVLKILKDGGKYIFRTPHAHQGPSDLSKVFGCDKPMGMHLKEYTFAEMNEALRLSGFDKIGSVLRVPNRVQNLFGRIFIPQMSYKYLKYLIKIESAIAILPLQSMRRSMNGLLRYPIFSTIFMVAQKESDNHN
jgi:cyclopropane fatty-acyl-phospholipid synthase-like methyltransferase